MNRKDAENAKKMKKTYPCTLKQFLLLGQLGFLEIGMSRKEIISHIGLPRKFNEYQDLETQKHWNYNSLAIGWNVEEKILESILLHVDIGIQLPEPLTPLGYAPTMNTTIDEFKYYLNLELIDYQQRQHPIAKSITVLDISANIHVMFGRDGKQPAHLEAIYCNFDIYG